MEPSADIEAAINVLCVISNRPQILNPCNGLYPPPVRVPIWAGGT